MKLLIVDDEPPARARLQRMVDEFAGWQVVAEAGNGQEALEAVSKFEPDVVLMDIRMPGIDGLEAAHHLTHLPNPPAVIFTTAYGEHALEAFEAQAIAYLLKPIRQDKLEEALQRAKRVTQAQLAVLNQDSPLGASRTHVCARYRGGVHLVPVDEILYFQADQKYVTVHHFGGEVLIEDTLKSLEDEFGDRFLRVHRNALVAKRHLQGVDKDAEGKYFALLENSDKHPEISRRHVTMLKKLMQSW